MIIILLLLCLMTINSCAYSDSEWFLKQINWYYNIKIEADMNLIYHVDDKSFTDTIYYYVYEVSLEDINLPFEERPYDDLFNLYNSSIYDQIDDSYEIFSSHEYLYYENITKNNDKLYVIYDKTNKWLIFHAYL